MKNIHVLSTDKPSRLFEIINFNYIFDNRNIYSDEYKKLHKWREKHIYITSDEEIKEGDWVIDDEQDVFQVLEINHTKGVLRSDGFTYVIDVCKKIILTTDLDLIKDGVQAIDDEFLDWFVKNPSCEFVDVVYGFFNPMGRQVDPNDLGQNHSKCVWKYKIIIPKEEFLKQERMSGSKTVSKILDGGKPSKFLIDEIGQFNFTKNKLYNQEEVGELVYKIIGEYGNHYGIMIDGEMINELFEKFKKK